jgi:hypothetical protein
MSSGPLWLLACADGKAARRRGEPRDPTPYLPRYEGAQGARPPDLAWLDGHDEADEEMAFEESRPRHIGQVEWSPVKRKRDVTIP